MRAKLMLLLLCLAFASPAFAQNNDAAMLEQYEKEFALSAGGMCDGMRSAIFVFKGKTYDKMTVFIPQNPTKTFIVIKKEAGNEYFITQQVNGSREVRKVDAPHWGSELIPESQNFFLFHFFGKEKPNDCGLNKNN